MRHDVTFQSVRSWQRRGRIVDKLIVIFLLIASMGHSCATKSSLPGRARSARASKSSQPGRPGHPDRAIRGQIEPARASQKRPGPPNRSSQGAQGRDRAGKGAQAALAGRPSCPRKCQVDRPRRAISLWIIGGPFAPPYKYMIKCIQQ